MSTSLQSDDVGPVDVAVILVDGNRFNGDVAPALAELADSGVVRIIVMSFVQKGIDGALVVVQAEDR
ncbi:DUF6325 family protein [Jatrophihabitans sp. DSM 45814]